MRVAFRDHRGFGMPFAAALEAAGHEIVAPTLPADCLLIDGDFPFSLYPQLCERHEKVFLYPHGAGPRGWVWPVHEHTRGEFVPSGGYLESTQLDVAVVGWPFSPQAEFRHTSGQRVIFAPFHKDGLGRIPPVLREANENAERQLREAGVQFTVREGRGLAYDDLDAADLLVAGYGTMGYLGVARGCPTVIYGQEFAGGDCDPVTLAWTASPGYPHPNYPYDLADLSAACRTEAAEWREKWIGAPFDPDLFVKTLEGWL